MDLSFKYGFNDIYNFFLRLLVLELFRPMLGKLEIQLARIYRTGIRINFSRCDAVFAEKEFKIISSIPTVHIDKPVLNFCQYLN